MERRSPFRTFFRLRFGRIFGFTIGKSPRRLIVQPKPRFTTFVSRENLPKAQIFEKLKLPGKFRNHQNPFAKLCPKQAREKLASVGSHNGCDAIAVGGLRPTKNGTR